VAIDFLKKNNAGHATFLALDTIKPNIVDSERRFIITNGPGYINFANELVNANKKHRLVVDYLLGGVIVVDTYENALEMAKIIKYKFNIVTLDGERILPHGAIVGGSRKTKIALTNIPAQIEELKNQRTHIEKEIEENNKSVSELSVEIDLIREKKSVNNTAIGSAKTTIANLRLDMDKFKDEFKLLTGKNMDSNSEENSIDHELEKIILELSHLTVQKQEIQNELEVSTNMKEKI